MKKVLSIIILMTLLGCIINCSDAVFLKNEKKSDGTDRPDKMIELIKNQFYLFHRKECRYPNSFREIMLRYKYAPEDIETEKGNAFIFYKDKNSKEKWYRYVLDNSSESSFQIHSENNCGKQDWVGDNLTQWWYMPDKEFEKKEIEKRREIFKKKKMFFIFSNDENRKKAIRELRYFYNPMAFETLFEILENRTESVLIRAIAAVVILDFPKLTRFKQYVPRIERIIVEESRAIKNINKRTDRLLYEDQGIIIDRLSRLKISIEGK